MTDAEQREAARQFINSWRKGGGEKRYGIPDTIPKKETAEEKTKREHKFDPLTMPPELRKAHTKNNIAVMQAYGFSTKMSEADCVAALMKMYQELVEKMNR